MKMNRLLKMMKRRVRNDLIWRKRRLRMMGRMRKSQGEEMNYWDHQREKGWENKDINQN